MDEKQVEDSENRYGVYLGFGLNSTLHQVLYKTTQ